ncbi:MAG: helix-turn-helix domain-containing protein [Vulcanimicrobiota bacterium]
MSSLGEYLASIRADRNLTLRQVEEATNREVSNAYLSQIENGRVGKPSPNILHALAVLYDISYPKLMEMAGYVVPSKKREPTERHGSIATFAEHHLTSEEESQLLAYLKFIRSQNPKDADDASQR